MESKEKKQEIIKESLTENELLRINNAVLTVNNISLQLDMAQHIRNNLVGEILREHGFSPDAKIILNSQTPRIEGIKID
jgi:hypothetical protein